MPKTPGVRAADARRKRRIDAAIVREDRILSHYAAGKSYDQIGEEMRAEFGGSFGQSTLRRMVARGLGRRAAQIPDDVAVARQMLLERFERLFTAHMPLAIGDGVDGVADVRSADLVRRLLNDMAEILGVKRLPPAPSEINNTIIITPENIDQARQQVLSHLDVERTKHEIVDGHLAAVGTGLDELISAHEDSDTLAPPPGVAPTQENEAA